MRQRLSEVLGQQVVVENPSGADGTVGSNRVAKAPPDGYQFVIGNSGTHAWSQSLYKKPPYNTLTDFTRGRTGRGGAARPDHAEEFSRQLAARVHRLCEGEPSDA